MATAINNRPGTRIKRVLARFGIRPNMGCGCTALANKMDEVGSAKVLEELDSYADEMYESIKKWRRGREVIPQPPLIVVRNFIVWACSA
jgi:hypothetical protein